MSYYRAGDMIDVLSKGLGVPGWLVSLGKWMDENDPQYQARMDYLSGKRPSRWATPELEPLGISTTSYTLPTTTPTRPARRRRTRRVRRHHRR